jgi:hypothetical protein
VPLYVVYPAVGEARPEILPAILTPRIVIDALERAAVAPPARPIATERRGAP